MKQLLHLTSMIPNMHAICCPADVLQAMLFSALYGRFTYLPICHSTLGDLNHVLSPFCASFIDNNNAPTQQRSPRRSEIQCINGRRCSNKTTAPPKSIGYHNKISPSSAYDKLGEKSKSILFLSFKNVSNGFDLLLLMSAGNGKKQTYH